MGTIPKLKHQALIYEDAYDHGISYFVRCKSHRICDYTSERFGTYELALKDLLEHIGFQQFQFTWGNPVESMIDRD